MSRNIILIVILVLVFVALFYYFSPSDITEPQLSDPELSDSDFLYEMSGSITEVKTNSIIVEGTIKSSNPEDNYSEGQYIESIEFEITPETKFIKSEIVITAEQILSEEEFTPETRQKEGNMSDLASGVEIFWVKSKNNLYTDNRAIATEIHYFIYGLPDISI
jgi:hypothetical protein